MNEKILRAYHGIAYKLTTLTIRTQILQGIMGGVPVACPICGCIEFDIPSDDNFLKIDTICCVGCAVEYPISSYPYRVWTPCGEAVIYPDRILNTHLPHCSLTWSNK